MTTESPSRRVSLNIDAYGTYARASALADYLEVAALQGIRITEAALARLVEENDWARLSRRQFLTVSNVEEDPDAWAATVYGIIRERAAVLGSDYPFDIGTSSIRCKLPRSSCFDSSYIALLAITVVHAWSLAVTGDPKELYRYYPRCEGRTGVVCWHGGERGGPGEFLRVPPAASR
jgi:hypothetical protein